MPSSANQEKRTVAKIANEILLCGRLQGMGVRPAIYRLANQLSLVGTVRNTPDGVTIHVEGAPWQIDSFWNELPASLPSEAQITDASRCAVSVTGSLAFEIATKDSSEAIVTNVPLDTAVCRDCLNEIHALGNRRYRYPFNSCVRCGPRYTIIRAMPFEREETAMVDFPWCEECQAEYRSVMDRRFHAQTISCPKCGPRLWCVTSDGRRVDDQEKAIELAARSLMRGGIVAMKGVGGYQLLVDATNAEAVQRLRRRKERTSKPFALMVRTLSNVRRFAVVDNQEVQALSSSANPIVLLRAKPDTDIAPSINPCLNTVGIMLPTSPLHELLLQCVDRPLICTSGNREGEPLAFEVEHAEEMLADICDLFMHHNRTIVRPIDDSVVRIVAGKCVTLRLARGMAPLRLNLDSSKTQIALGGQLKSTMAWSHSKSTLLGPHLGNLGNIRGQERFLWHLDDCQSLYRFSANRAVHDSHPGYFTSQVARREYSDTMGVQHHRAHVLAAMLEHRLLNEKVLGVAWDGTGYGTDHTVWGGEFIEVDGDQWRRKACLRPFSLPGGDKAVYEPWRVALSLLSQAESSSPIDDLPIFSSLKKELSLVRQILDLPQFSPITTSGGRLFDGIAALVLSCQKCDYEGQLPMMLESIADREERGAYEMEIEEKSVLELDWGRLVQQVLHDICCKLAPGRISMKCHRGIAKGIMAVCRRFADRPIVITGGVFQNRLLTELIVEMAQNHQQPFYLPGVIPPGDGGLAAGQMVAASLCEKR